MDELFLNGRADLEAAAKARSKMTTSALSLSGDDAKTIATLHQFLMDMDGCDVHLAAVVARLEQLAELHGQASHFATRLASAETMVTESASMLAGIENVLQRVETGFAENQTILQQNVANLDERIQKLS
jgi:benzoyl-CoA reductase/2-hydroxyglutaryl-CoA dehydratase subunit BcrC/BadD/HgdB|mmetsp:Transcript_24151/g.43635  ORF Transcript_24151/g.43635 Transcript_24151/m.43635 type:complete len:129 (-) Transcript_24151:88-474(-)